MKKINYVLASSATAVLLASAPMLASAHDTSASAHASANARVRGDSHPGLHLDSMFHLGSFTGKSDRGHDHSHNKPMDKEHAVVGIVTAITGSTFTIDPVGDKSTTTVSTSSSTLFRTNGQATTSNALKVGSHVALIGTSTSETNISASVVSIFSKGFGFFKHFLRGEDR